MKILYVFRSLAQWGGIERVLVDKMNYLVAMYNYDVYMLTADQGDHSVPYPLEDGVHFEDLCIRFHQQYLYRGLKRLIVARRLSRLFKQRLSARLQEIKPDIIVCTTANYIDINILAELKGTVPLIVESHSIYQKTFGQKGLRHRYADFMYYRGLSKVQMIIALTKEDAKEWSRIIGHVCVIPNMVHLNEGEVSSLDHKRVIWVGRFDYQKCPMEMIEVWKIVYPKFSGWHLDIYGEGEQREKLERMASTIGMNIHIHQPAYNIFDSYRNSSIMVSTSLFEPFGLVIPEAMSCGLPVVSYDVPYGPASIISDGVNGFLINKRNINEFANRVCQLIEDEELRFRIGQAAIKSAQCYRADLIMSKWKELFEELRSKE
jgi:glycosyltransferase involved in cell wall biosynthesis